MPSLDAVLASVSKKITPSEKEAKTIYAAIDKVVNTAGKVIKPHKLTCLLAGSFTRSTWLSNKKEFDIFIQFPEDYPREKLEKLGLEIGSKIVSALKGSSVVAYAEHPYTRAKLLGFDVDIVPCFKVKSAEAIKSAVDRTPFHNQYLSKKLSPNQSADVRLMKQFCKSIGVYGSDLKTSGFSGYLCELLTIQYGTFKNLVAEASKWTAGSVFIDIENKRKGKEPDSNKQQPVSGQHPIIPQEFRNQPLVIIDPVDPKRNVAAAVAPDKFVKFSESCKLLLSKPSERLFFLPKKAYTAAIFKKKAQTRATQILFVKTSRPTEGKEIIVDDILYPQLKKTAKRLAGILKENDFRVLGFDVWSDEKTCGVLLELEVWELPNIRRIIGPPISIKKHSEEFLKKYSKARILVEDSTWVAEAPRKFMSAKTKIHHSISVPLKDLLSKGIASHMAASFSKGFFIFENSQISKLLKNKGFGEFLFEYFEGKVK